ncbi:MAG: hypothetical protein ACKO8O_07095 [Betaproteobacteria bacterium]
MTSLFTDIFRIPGSTHRIEPWVAGVPVVVSTLGALAAATLSVREVLRLSAAEAMQPPAPPVSATTAAVCRSGHRDARPPSP